MEAVVCALVAFELFRVLAMYLWRVLMGRCVSRGVACVCGLLLDDYLICAVPRCTRSGAGVSVYVTDLVTPGRLGKMRLEERFAAGGRVDG